MVTKKELRAAALKRRTELARRLPDFALRIEECADALGLAPGATVAGYWPRGDEADPRRLMQALRAKGHPLALPAVRDDALVFLSWRAGDATSASAFGIEEPLEHVGRVAPTAFLVPLLAFDSRGHRLGYGRGYYDRALAQAGLTAIGIAYAGQEVEALPDESHDRALDLVVTEKGVRGF